jgi:hypothetical protein
MLCIYVDVLCACKVVSRKSAMSFVKKVKFGGKKNSLQNISLSLNEKCRFTSRIEMCRVKNLFVFFII